MEQMTDEQGREAMKQAWLQHQQMLIQGTLELKARLLIATSSNMVSAEVRKVLWEHLLGMAAMVEVKEV